MVQLGDVVTLVRAAGIDVDADSLKASVPLVLQGLDSMDIATLMFQVEQRYGVTVSPEASYRLRCLTDFVELLNSTEGVAEAAPAD
jgi:acyl carrier protein